MYFNIKKISFKFIKFLKEKIIFLTIIFTIYKRFKFWNFILFKIVINKIYILNINDIIKFFLNYYFNSIILFDDIFFLFFLKIFKLISSSIYSFSSKSFINSIVSSISGLSFGFFLKVNQLSFANQKIYYFDK